MEVERNHQAVQPTIFKTHTHDVTWKRNPDQLPTARIESKFVSNLPHFPERGEKWGCQNAEAAQHSAPKPILKQTSLIRLFKRLYIFFFFPRNPGSQQHLTTTIKNPSSSPVLYSGKDKRDKAPRSRGCPRFRISLFRGYRSIPKLRELPGGCGAHLPAGP